MKIIRKNKILLTIVIVLMLSVFSMIPQMAIANEECFAGAQSGNKVEPTCHCEPKNPRCCNLGYCDNELKDVPPTSGSYDDGVLFVTITVDEKFFDWDSNIPVDAVIVKGGEGGCANLYEYNPASTGDTNLHATTKLSGEPYGLSHIDFCYSDPECPTCSIEPVEAVCEDDGAVFSLDATIDPGDYTSYDLLWSDGGAGGIFSGVSIEDPTWTPPPGFTGTATLKLTVTADGCEESICTVDVTVYPNPACNIVCDPEDCTACENGEVKLTETGNDAVKWLWSTGETTKSIIVTASGTYSVTVTDANGCESTCEKKVTIYEEPACNITCDPEDCTACENGGVTLTETGGDAEKWLWSTGETTKSIIVTASGTYSVTITDEFGCQSTCEKKVTVYPKPVCIIAGVEPICAGESVQLYAAVNGGTPGYTYSWDDGVVGGTFSDSNIEDPTWTPPSGFTGIATLTLTVTDSKGCTTTCFVDVIVKHCEKKPCKCSLVVLKRDEAGNPIDGAVFEVDGIEKTTSGGEARWDNLECNTTYEVKEISPEKVTRSITLGDCGERSTMRVVNKIEEGELEVLGIMEVLPFTGPAIPYSPFIGISTVLAGTFLYILSKTKKKR